MFQGNHQTGPKLLDYILGSENNIEKALSVFRAQEGSVSPNSLGVRTA